MLQSHSTSLLFVNQSSILIQKNAPAND